MSIMVSPRIRIVAARPVRVRRAGRLPLGYSLLIAAALSAGMWIGMALIAIRLWP